MSFTNDEFDRLERMIYRPVSTRPDWLKAWRNEVHFLLFLARRAVDADDEELVVYRQEYGDYGLWVRPAAMFAETVVVDGQAVPRFAFVRE